MEAKWTIKNKKIEMASWVEALGASPVVIRAMVNRGIEDVAQGKRFLNPSEADLYGAELFKDMGLAQEAVSEALKAGEKIAIYGDYDVDGVMSTTILYKGLTELVQKEQVSYYIPHREREGYGLNQQAISRLAKAGVKLIIACDNGITALDEVAYANELGVGVVILDHHEPIVKGGKECVPEAKAVVNQKQHHCEYPFKHLCAGSVCYKFVMALYEHLGETMPQQQQEELLAFSGIATLCDVVDLVEENRAIVRLAMDILAKEVTNLGLKQLAKEKNLVVLDEEAIGFTIGPCINAAGRLADAKIAVDLFVTEDAETAKQLAKLLAEMNDERKLITKEAMEMVEAELAGKSLDSVIVAYHPHIHEAVAGIVAGRLKDKYHRPAVVLTMGEGYVKGSARSIESYDIYEGLAQYRHLFHRFGGHQMAAGLSLEEANVPALRAGLNDNFNGDLQEVINIDMPLVLTDATYTLAKSLEVLKPFGKANQPPLFGTKKVKVLALRAMPEKNTLIFTFETDRQVGIKGICFGDTSKFKYMVTQAYDGYTTDKIMSGILRNTEIFLDILYYLDINVYNGITSVQLRIRDYRIST